MNHFDFKNKYIWKSVDVDNAFGSQCVDLAKAYSKEVYNIALWKTGNAKDWFINWVGLSQWHQKVKYLPWKIAPQGAIIFWWNWVYGHVAIVDSANEKEVTFIEQNGVGDNPATPQNEMWNWVGGNAIRLRKSSYNNVLWWLVDPTTSTIVDQALKWNSELWKATNEQSIRDILWNTNNFIRKYYE
jgi:hypothetical protein